MFMVDEEKIEETDKVLVIVTNQYMFEQLSWYRTKYPEGLWDAIVIKFGVGNDDLMSIMYNKCVESGFFNKVTYYGYRVPSNSLYKKIYMMIRYVCQSITRNRERSDKKWIEEITGERDYKKVIVQYTHDLIPMAALNAMPNSVLVCLEDGLSDYLPVTGIKHWAELVNYMLAKMNVANVKAYGHQYKLKYDNRLIKYCSLPDKMQYRGYKKMKQLFVDDDRKISYSEKEYLLVQEKYDMVVFLTAFSDYGVDDIVYDLLHKWLRENYGEKKILFKPHPREEFTLHWDDLDIHVGAKETAGETLLDLMPDVEVLFMFVSSVLLKTCREKRKFRIIRFEGINSVEYQWALQNVSKLLGLNDENWIVL